MKGFFLAPKLIVFSMVFLLCSIMLSLTGVAWAYFAESVTTTAEYNVVQTSSKVFESTLNATSVSVGSEYTSQSTIAAGASKTLTIQNTTNFQTANVQANKVLMRVSFSVKNGAVATTNYGFNLVDASVHTMVNGAPNAGFTAIENGYYYYNAPMLKNEYAPFATFSNTGSSAMHVFLNVEVVQASLDVATNYWNYKTGENQASNRLSSTKTVDGVSITSANGLIVMVPNGASWRQATDSDSLDSAYTANANTVSINTLSGAAGNCMRIYNNSNSPMIMALRMHVSLYQGGTSSTEWSAGGLFENLALTFNFANGSQDYWLDIRDNAATHTFNVASSGSYISFLYNRLVNPGESVYALSNQITVQNPVNQNGYTFRIICEVLGYDSALSSAVDDYLAITVDDDDLNGGSISVADRVPLYYAYTTTDSTKNTYTTQLDSNGKLIGRAAFYSQYANWFNTISPSLT